MAQSAEKITTQMHQSDSALQSATAEVKNLNGLALSLRGSFSNSRL